MFNLTDRPLLRLFTLCILYVAQGIPYGFVTVTFAALLAKNGLTVQEVGAFTSVALIPWAFKWIWGPLIDRWGFPAMGRRRPWILAAQTGMIITLLGMALVPDPTTHLKSIGVLVFVHNICTSLQDVSVDALAVDLLRESERGRVNGFMYGSSYFGMFLGGAFLSHFVIESGLQIAFMIMISMLVAIMLVPLLLRERQGEKLLPWSKGTSQLAPTEQLAQSSIELFVYLKRAFSLRSTLLAAAIGLTIFIASGILTPITKVLILQDLQWELKDFTNLEGGYGVFLGLAGAIIGGFLADRFGPKRIATVGCIFLAASYAMFGCSSPDAGIIPWFDWNDRSVVISFILIETWMSSMISASLFAMFMTVSWPKVAATQFTAYMAILNLSRASGLKLSGTLDELFSTPNIFVGVAILQLMVIAIFPFIDVHQARRVLGRENGERRV